MTTFQQNPLVIGLNEIERQVKYWVEFDLKQRDAEGLETTDATHIMSPPGWPSHGQLKAWVKCLKEAQLALETEDCFNKLTDGTEWILRYIGQVRSQLLPHDRAFLELAAKEIELLKAKLKEKQEANG